MEYKMLIGETLFYIKTPIPIKWNPEEEKFVYFNECYRQKVNVNIEFVKKFPFFIEEEKYNGKGLRAGLNGKGQETRVYDAVFLSDRPTYAMSVLKCYQIDIYFIDDMKLWNNPNIRIWNLVHMEQLLLRVDALVFHCSYLTYDNKAILFSAPSGTGKTTQAKLWEKLYPAKIVNGDKAILQKKDGLWYARGYPFHGSADECINEDYPIETIVIVRQHTEDEIEELSDFDKVSAIYSETTVNSWNEDSINQSLDLIMNIVESVKIIKQKCTTKDNACLTLYQYLKEE